MDRIELKAKMIEQEPFPAKALGLVPEVKFGDLSHGFSPTHSEYVLSIPDKILFQDEPIVVSSLCLETTGLLGINIDLTNRRDLEGLLNVRTEVVSLSNSRFVEVASNQLLSFGEPMIFRLLNLCEELQAAIHLKISGYVPDWQSDIRDLLDQMDGFVAALGLPQPYRAHGSDDATSPDEEQIHKFIHEVSTSTDLSVLCFDKAGVSSGGILSRQRFWFGL